MSCFRTQFLQNKTIGKLTYYLEFIYSEKATKFCEISTLDLTVTLHRTNLMWCFCKKFVSFSQNLNFINAASTQDCINGSGRKKSNRYILGQKMFFLPMKICNFNFVVVILEPLFRHWKGIFSTFPVCF